MTKISACDNPAIIFDRTALRRNRDRAAKNPVAHDFLHREVAARLYDKYLDINRDFHTILDLGCRGGELGKLLPDKYVINLDLSRKFPGCDVQADEEFLPCKPGSLDLIITNLSLHWINDLPGCLAQIKQSLKPDGLFLGALFGGETLTELRQSLMAAEINIRGGASPRISPFVDIRTIGGLLQRAGFALPVIDTDRITVTYDNAFKLMQDLHAMGESNILINRARGLTSPQIMTECARIYQQKFTNRKGRITASFDILYLLGWSPHESQQQPLKPGQGKVSLTEVFGGKG